MIFYFKSDGNKLLLDSQSKTIQWTRRGFLNYFHKSSLNRIGFSFWPHYEAEVQNRAGRLPVTQCVRVTSHRMGRLDGQT